MKRKKHRSGYKSFPHKKRAAAAALFLAVFFICKSIIAAHQNDLFNESAFFLSYRLNEIEAYSFQVLANTSINRLLTRYAQSGEKYQVNEWNTVFSEYMESLVGSNRLIYDAFFFSSEDVAKAALTMRENLSFSEKAALKNEPIITHILNSHGVPLWFNTEKGLFSVRLIRNVQTGKSLGVLCFVVDRSVLKQFFQSNAYFKKLFLIQKDGAVLFSANNPESAKRLHIGTTAGYYRSEYTGQIGYICASKQLTKEAALFLVLRTGLWESVLFSNPVFFTLLFGFMVYICFIFYRYKTSAAAVQEPCGIPVPPELCMLSQQEYRICTLMAGGCTNKEIAYRLQLKEQTVKNYVYAVYKKLNVSGRVEASVLIHGIFDKQNQK